MPTELRACPFCAGAYVPAHPKMCQQRPSTSAPNLEELTEGRGWRVSCYGCGVGTWPNLKYTREQAIAAWNTRDGLTPAEPQTAGVALVVRRDDGAPRIGYWHRNEMTALPSGGMRMTKIPDPAGTAFTTLCTFNYPDADDWPERVLAALSRPPPYG